MIQLLRLEKNLDLEKVINLKEAKKFIRDRKYYATRIITIDQLNKQ